MVDIFVWCFQERKMLVKNEIILVLGCDVFIEQREDKLLVEYNDFGNDL